MASRSAIRSTKVTSGSAARRVDSSVSPSAVSCWSDSGETSAKSTAAISSGVMPVSSDSWDSFGSQPRRFCSRSRAAQSVCPFSRMVLPTLMGPSSRRKRRISPAILGTA